MAYDASVHVHEGPGGNAGPTNLAQAEAKIASLKAKIAKLEGWVSDAKAELKAAERAVPDAKKADGVREAKERAQVEGEQ